MTKEEKLQQELLEAKAKLSDLQITPEPKKKPYTREEIAEHKEKGHLIGKPDQKLVEGHDESDLQEWEMWVCEMGLKDIGFIPEIGKAWSVPDYLIPLKREKTGLKGNDKTFQYMNNQMDYRYPAADKRYIVHLPKGFEASKRYKCSYWIQEIRGQAGDQLLPRLLVIDHPRVTGAPEKK